MPPRATVGPYRLVSPSASIIRELTGASTAMPRRSAATAGPPLAGTGRHPDEGDTRERILDIALDLFIEQGYDKTTLRQIAEPLGFTRAAIYYHLFCGPALSQTGGHGDPRPPELGCCLGGGHMAEVVDGVDALRRAARERLCSGAHAIKRHRDHDSRGGEHPPSHRKLPAEPRQVGLARAAMAGWLGGCPQADEVVLVASAARRRSMRRSPRCWTARSRPFAEIRKRTLAHDCTDANRAKLLGTAWRVS